MLLLLKSVQKIAKLPPTWNSGTVNRSDGFDTEIDIRFL